MSGSEIPATYDGLPVVTAARARALDLAAQRRGIPASELMERAGEAVAREMEAMLEAPSGAIAVCCGRGSNGGDGLAAARELARRGFGVTVFLCPPKAGQGYSELLEDKLERARRAGALILSPGREERPPALARAQAAIDALLGTGFRGRPEGDVERMIRQLNDSGKPVLAVDLPSGLDPDTGARAGSCVAAAATVTLGLVKRGLLACQARPFVGRLTLADIGYPRDLLRAA